MKTKHNKKRNTAFIFESLIHEMTKAVMTKDKKRKTALLSIFREHFSSGSILEKELQCFQALMEGRGLDKYTAEKIIHRAKEEHSSLDKQNIFQEQSQVIKKINKEIGPHVFSNFVPNYRMAATVSQIFSSKATVSQKVLMERQVLEKLVEAPSKDEEDIKPVDNLVVKSFADKYNDVYRDLLPEQRNLLEKFILAFGDNDVDFRLELGNELRRIYEEVENSLKLPEVSSDENMVANTHKVLEEIKSYDVSMVGEHQLKKILKLQSLASEYSKDAS